MLGKELIVLCFLLNSNYYDLPMAVTTQNWNDFLREDLQLKMPVQTFYIMKTVNFGENKIIYDLTDFEF